MLIKIRVGCVKNLLLFLMLLPGISYTADFTVNTTLDSVDTNPGDGNCLISNGGCSLRAAVMETNALSGADTITVPANTYSLFIGSAGEDQAAEGDLDILDDLTITGDNPDTTIITGNFNAFRVFHVLKRADSSLPTVTFKKLTLTKGAGDGAVLHNSGISILDDVTISDASSDKVAILNTQDLVINNSRIINNFYGIESKASSGQSKSLTINGSHFENNGGDGGRALYSDAISTKIKNTVFLSNNSSFGVQNLSFRIKSLTT